MLHSGSILVACEKPRGVLVRELLHLKLGWFDPDQVHTRPLTLPVYEPAYRIKHEALLPARFLLSSLFESSRHMWGNSILQTARRCLICAQDSLFQLSVINLKNCCFYHAAISKAGTATGGITVLGD